MKNQIESFKLAKSAFAKAETAAKIAAAEQAGEARAEKRHAAKALDTAQDELLAAARATMSEDNGDQVVIDLVTALDWYSKPPSEHETECMRIAIAAGADWTAFKAVACAQRISRTDTIILPAGRYENLSRGKGWCRQGKGASATWGERVKGGYLVGAGEWVVGSDDGFKRKDQTDWKVEHITVGGQTWTIAN